MINRWPPCLQPLRTGDRAPGGWVWPVKVRSLGGGSRRDAEGKHQSPAGEGRASWGLWAEWLQRVWNLLPLSSPRLAQSPTPRSPTPKRLRLRLGWAAPGSFHKSTCNLKLSFPGELQRKPCAHSGEVQWWTLGSAGRRKGRWEGLWTRLLGWLSSSWAPPATPAGTAPRSLITAMFPSSRWPPGSKSPSSWCTWLSSWWASWGTVSPFGSPRCYRRKATCRRRWQITWWAWLAPTSWSSSSACPWSSTASSGTPWPHPATPCPARYTRSSLRLAAMPRCCTCWPSASSATSPSATPSGIRPCRGPARWNCWLASSGSPPP